MHCRNMVLPTVKALYGYEPNCRDEDTDNIHSIFVDQWDWEIIIDRHERNINTLKEIVRKVYKALKRHRKIYGEIEYDYIEETFRRKFSLSHHRNWRISYPDPPPKNGEYRTLVYTKALSLSCRSEITWHPVRR